MKKTHLFTALFAVLVTVANAQSNFGTDYFGIGEYQIAKKYFEQQVSQSPAEANYYLGEIAFAEGKTDDAKAFYEKGIAASPLYMLNYVGQGKVLLKSNPKAAELSFAAALKKNKKDVAVNVAIARAYYECGMKEMALAKIELARKFGKKSPLVYTLEGDIYRAENKPGDAAGKYEQAIYFDPNYAVASILYGQVYSSINPKESVEIFKKVIAAHPDYTVVYRDLGKSYNSSQVGQYQNAIDAFKTYFAAGNYNLDDITQFASAYYFTDQFGPSIELLNEGLKIDSTNFVVNRLRMYNAAKTNDNQNGVAIADRFFSLKGTFIPEDYKLYALVLTNGGQYDKALEVYNNILATDATRADLYKEMVTVYNKMGNSLKAAESYQKYIDLTGAENVEAIDFYQMGRSYYAAGTALLADTTAATGAISQKLGKELLVKADTTFGIVSRLIPDSYTGYLWRGHTNSALDPETSLGLAKPYYEATINAILSKVTDGAPVNGNRKDLIVSYRYLAYFYYLKEDQANASLYCNKILELDPNNENAKLLLDSYKQPVKK